MNFSLRITSVVIFSPTIFACISCQLMKNIVHSSTSMSAIDFFCSVDKVKGVDGKERVVVTFDGKFLPHTEHVSNHS